MPLLKNVRHERFAQLLAMGSSADEAYEKAGYASNRGNASTLKANQSVQDRVEEIVSLAAARAEISVASVLTELGKIGFSDIRKAIRWYSQANVAAVDSEGEMQALIDEGEVRIAVANQVELVSSDEIDDDTAAAIAEISQNAQGGIKVKFHDKRGALVDIGRHLGMFPTKIEGNFNVQHFLSPEQARQRIGVRIERAKQPLIEGEAVRSEP